MTGTSDNHAEQALLEGLLREAAKDDPEATWALLGHVYKELKVLAHGTRNHSPKSVGPGTTELLHETFLRLLKTGKKQSWEHRRYFFAAAMGALQNVWIDHLRRANSRKRGAGRTPFPLSDEFAAAEDADVLADADAVERALAQLQATLPEAYTAFQCRYFGHLTVSDTAELLELSTKKVVQRSELARAWLSSRLTH